MSQGVRLTNAMIEELQGTFSLRDYAEAGKIVSADIGPVVRSVKGLKPLESEVQEMIQIVDRDHGGMADLQAVVQLISATCTQPDPETPEDMIEMFRMYDKEGRGTISNADMRHLLCSVGEKFRDDEADDLIKLSGCAERGQVNYRKFVETIMRA